ncbi:alkaline phosphatase [Asticcacaulis sp. 201]|uniref:alkaline phosphatase n=1 Tax=Asticcacaulis sp. 201 TaxID=3028787 RepID=UPI002915D401|nr:alkaline phosphatase [Asticcacaulis sp. 201]MDV6330401.1 alkaline phosphatase [Asticcacaulis sp. 201]
MPIGRFSSLIALMWAIALPVAAQDPLPAVRDRSQNIDYYQGDKALQEALKRAPNVRPAKNVILFIGDGMGINSVTAGRILAGQKRGLDGASYRLSFETFPYGGFSKTYSIDNLVTDSANGISAIMTGVKTRNAAIGVDGSITTNRCRGALKARVESLAETAKLSGRSAGIVTTAGVTDATPAGAYGHTPSRQWRADSDMSAEAIENGCIDLARQLVEAPAAIRMDVAMGGDIEKFLPDLDPRKGARADGRDLTREWLSQSPHAVFADSLSALKSLDAKKTDHLLGLFSEGDLPSPVDPEHNTIPDLDQMTASAIDVLSQNPNGFFLMVESASIDKWHHVNNGYRALTDVDELSKAVQVALDKTNPADTLIIVTADHSHGLVMSGYASRNASIMGLAQIDGKPLLDDKGQPYTILSYASGPGAKRDDTDKTPLTEEVAESPDYHQQALILTGSAKHAGEDVPVYATGPQAHLLSGTVESSYIYQVMAYALSLKAEKPAATKP